MFPDAREYVSIEKEDDDDVLNAELPPHHLPKSRDKMICLHYWAYFTHGTLLFLCISFLCLWVRARNQSLTLPYSPANEAVEYYKELKLIKGTLNYTSIYRGKPNPELDAAWIRVSTGVPPTRITTEQLLMLGQSDTPSRVKYQEEDGGGYMAALEVTHQLHCLNMLRKYLHFDHYGQFDPVFTKNKPETYRLHLEHCVDILRQVLMCSADVGIITFEWVKGISGPYPNFNTKHQCRKFENVRSWAVTNAVKIPSRRVIRLNGEVDLPQVP